MLLLWLGYFACSNGLGWLASVAGWLNPVYAWIFLASYLLYAGWLLSRPGGGIRRGRLPVRLVKRFRSPAAILWGLCFLFIVLGAVLHAPNNFDAHTYRLPRMLAWWVEGGWHWIEPVVNDRQNYSAVVVEWASMPLLMAGGALRPLVLVNLGAYALLPGLVFTVFQGLGVPARARWLCMWLLPLGYGFILQAGSIGNDLPGVTMFLTALYYGLRWRKTGCKGDLALSIMAMAVTTGIKATNIPLGLVWLVVVAFDWRKLLRSWPVVLAAGFVSLPLSIIPIGWMNIQQLGHWSGLAEDDAMRLADPWAGLAGNSIQMLVGLVEIPVNPLAGKMRSGVELLMPSTMQEWLAREFPRFQISIGELPQEEASGLGLAVSILLLILMCRSRWRTHEGGFLFRGFMGGSFLVALASYLLMAGSESTARLLLPFYLPGAGALLMWTRRLQLPSRTIRVALFLLLAGGTLLPLALTPARPLWPWKAALARLPESGIVERARQVYAGYSTRHDVFGPLNAEFSEEWTRIGFVTPGDDPETALWKPFGGRKVISFSRLDEVPPARVDCVVIRARAWDQSPATEGWRVTGRQRLVSKVREGPEEWLVLSPVHQSFQTKPSPGWTGSR